MKAGDRIQLKCGSVATILSLTPPTVKIKSQGEMEVFMRTGGAWWNEGVIVFQAEAIPQLIEILRTFLLERIP